MKGFSMVELIFVVAVMGILTSIVVSSMNTTRIKKEQERIVQSLAVHVDKQKANTQAGKDGAVHGIKFNPTSYVLYTGNSFSPNSASNVVIEINPDYELSETLSNPNNLLFFSRLTGGANENATITISHVDERVSPQTIVISEFGTISVIE